jgi:hypothetical protein
MRRLDTPALHRICSTALADLTPERARDVEDEMGWLGRWWLEPEVLRRAATGRGYPERAKDYARHPELPTGRGACWVLFANEDAGELKLLRKAFLLPLRWAPGERHDPRLPKPLLDRADRVLGAVLRGTAAGTAGASWGLRFGVEKEPAPDLSGLDFLPPSAWAALAAGLLLALDEAGPNPRVWATGAWAEPGGGIVRIDFLKPKLRLGMACGAEAVFVPESQVEEAATAVQQIAAELEADPEGLRLLHEEAPRSAPKVGVPRPEIGRLREGTARPRAALDEYLARLFQRPLLTDPPATRRAWYRLLVERGDAAAARSWFVDALLLEIASECRRHLVGQCGDGLPTDLVTIASDSWELVPLMVEIVRPRRCLALYTDNKVEERDRALQATRRLLDERRGGCDLIPREFKEKGDLFEPFAEEVRKFAAGGEPGALALDLTPGTKEMSLALQFAAAQPQNRLLYIRHQRQGSLVVPGSQRLLVRTAGAIA